MSWCFGKYSRSNPFVFSFVPVSTVDAAREVKFYTQCFCYQTMLGNSLPRSGVIDRNICESSNSIMAFWTASAFWQEFSSPTQNDFCVPSASANKLHPLYPVRYRLPNVQSDCDFAPKWDGRSNGWISEFCHVFHDDFCMPCFAFVAQFATGFAFAYIKQP